MKSNRHLLYIAHSKNHYLLSYMHGGKGKHQHSLIIETRNNKVKILNLTVPFHSNLEALTHFLTKMKKFVLQTNEEL